MGRGWLLVAFLLVLGACAETSGSAPDQSISASSVVAPSPTSSTTAAASRAAEAPDETEDVGGEGLSADFGRAAVDAFNAAYDAADGEAILRMFPDREEADFAFASRLARHGEAEEFDRVPLDLAFLAVLAREAEAGLSGAGDIISMLARNELLPRWDPAELNWVGVDADRVIGLDDIQWVVTVTRVDDDSFVLELNHPEEVWIDAINRDFGDLPEDALSVVLFDEAYFGFPPIPPQSVAGGAMGSLADDLWLEIASGFSGSASGAVAVLRTYSSQADTAQVSANIELALTAGAGTLEDEAFWDALQVVALRSQFSSEEIEALTTDELRTFNIEKALWVLGASIRAPDWEYGQGGWLGFGNRRFVFRILNGVIGLGPNVYDLADPSDFPSAVGVPAVDRLGLVLAALTDITGVEYDETIFEPLP